MSFRDPRPDPSLARALRRVGADERHSARELAALRRRLLEQAEPLLRRRRQQAPWWEYALAWRRTLIPVALSAAAVATFSMIQLAPHSGDGDLTGAERAAVRPELLDAAANRMSSGDLLELIVAGSGSVEQGARAQSSDTVVPKGSAQ